MKTVTKKHTIMLKGVWRPARFRQLFGMRWSDPDFGGGEDNVVRSIAHGVISGCKAEFSSKPIRMDPVLVEMVESDTCHRAEQ